MENALEYSVATTLCTMVLTIGGCTYGVQTSEAAAKRAMVEKGATALEARCAFSYSADSACVALAARAPLK